MTKSKIIVSIVLLATTISLLSAVLINQSIIVLSGESDDDLAIETKTAVLESRDLRVFKDLDGILEYSDSIPLSPSDSGVLTYIAPEGSELSRGSVVFRLNHSSSDSELLVAKQQLASAENAVSQAELALEKLMAPATTAQVTSLNSALTQAESNLVTAQGNLDRIEVSYRIARESYCYEQRLFLKGSSLSLDSLCAEENLPMSGVQVDAIQDNLFVKEQITPLGENLLNQHTHYLSGVESRNLAEVQVSVARINLAELNDPPTVAEVSQANAALKSAQASLSTALSTMNNHAERVSATVLMFGNTPAWRELREGMSPGEDITQLKQNLILLSYGSAKSLLANQYFDTNTAEAVKKMQADLGLTVTGQIAFGDLVFLSGSSIVNYSLPLPNLGVGVNPNNALVTLTPIESTETTIGSDGIISITSKSLQKVQASIEVSNQDLINIGSKVQIELPDGSVVIGTIREIGKTAVVLEANQAGEPYLEVSVSLDEGISLPEWAGAPVTVSVTKEVAQNVLSAPIPSLLALLEGGYALEVLDQGSTRLVPVEVGIYADGWVEVEGIGLAPGTEIIVP